MRQAIRTRYFGPTNYRGSRIKASCEAGQVTVPYDQGINLSENHIAAADALLAKLGWNERSSIESGMLGNMDGAHVLVDRVAK